jgi:hypothetical protein
MEKIPCNPSVGADVEYLLMNMETREIEPACGLIGGTKEDPLLLESPRGGGYAIQEDNVMVEWNIPAAESWDVLYNNILHAKDLVNDHVQLAVGPEYRAVCQQEHHFTPLQLDSEQARTFGCEPDFDAYLGGVQRQDGAAATIGNWRTCGGHIHIGGDFQCPDFVAALFCELYISVFGRAPIDYSTQRAKWYGKPGIFRPKPYGIEYRTPDNMWTDNPNHIELVGQYAILCAQYLTNTSADELQSTFRKIPWVQIRGYLDGTKRTSTTRSHIIRACRNAGVNA